MNWDEPTLAAVAEHFKAYHGFDGVALRKIQKNDANFSEKDIRKIANVYFVSRGIKGRPKGSANDVHAHWLAREFSNLSVGSDECLRTRFEKCHDIAERGSQPGHGEDKYLHLNGFQISAMTKFMWFKQPLNWTPFDETAANGLKIKKKPPRDRSKIFYDRLYDLGFFQHAKNIQSKLRKTSHHYLFSERVIDKFLMLKGVDGDQRDMLFGDTATFLKLLQISCRVEIQKTAKTVRPCLLEFEQEISRYGT